MQNTSRPLVEQEDFHRHTLQAVVLRFREVPLRILYFIEHRCFVALLYVSTAQVAKYTTYARKGICQDGPCKVRCRLCCTCTMVNTDVGLRTRGSLQKMLGHNRQPKQGQKSYSTGER